MIIIADTETSPVIATDRVDARTMRVYDLGYLIVDDANGYEVIASRNYAISDVFRNSVLMQNAYYKDKLPWYYENMRNGSMTNVTMHEAWALFKADCEEYHITEVWAYNCRFDYTSLNETIKDYSNGFINYFTPYGVKFYDIMAVACRTIANSKKYVKWAIKSGNVSTKGNPKVGAEAMYRFINQDNDFIESHTALDDCRIELEVLKAAMRYKGKFHKEDGAEWGTGTAIPRKILKEMNK